MPHAAAGVGHVPRITRDHVHMHMRHSLASSSSGVESNVVPIGLRIKLLV